MRSNSIVRVVIALLLIAGVCAHASAQAVPAATPAPAAQRIVPAQVAAHDLAKLDSALATLAELSESSPAAGVVSIIGGGILIAGGAYFALQGSESESDGDQAARGIASAVVLGLGGASVAVGIRRMDYLSTDGRRLARFRAAVARGGMDAITFARFEGGLLAEGEIARQNRLAGGVAQLGLSVGGAGALTIAIAAQDIGDDARLGLGVLGGIYLVYGLWQGVVALTVESRVEQIVRQYTQTHAPASPTTEVALSPTVAPSGLGLALHGAF
ncbi:MAG TPA: hypothetical protein VK509_15980 [Polyangiales bacterium]|nr:hypothetical protein [Polyangiales bacterium]